MRFMNFRWNPSTSPWFHNLKRKNTNTSHQIFCITTEIYMKFRKHHHSTTMKNHPEKPPIKIPKSQNPTENPNENHQKSHWKSPKSPAISSFADEQRQPGLPRPHRELRGGHRVLRSHREGRASDSLIFRRSFPCFSRCSKGFSDFSGNIMEFLADFQDVFLVLVQFQWNV